MIGRSLEEGFDLGPHGVTPVLSWRARYAMVAPKKRN